MIEYLDMLQSIVDYGDIKENRTGIDTISIFNYNYSLQISKGFPLLTTKKMYWKPILIENLWFLGMSCLPDFLHKHGVHFWDAWLEEGPCQRWNEYTQKLERLPSLPEAYGVFWRSYPGDDYTYDSIDQFQRIIDELKKNPNSRRLVLTNWYPPSAWGAKLPPCHLMAIFNVQYKNKEPRLNLHLTQRSCDVPVGVPFNIAGYAFILHLVSHLTGIPVGEFGHTLVDAHIYVNQMDGVKEQLKRATLPLPKLTIDPNIKTLQDVDTLIRDATTQQILDAFRITGYISRPRIEFPVAV